MCAHRPSVVRFIAPPLAGQRQQLRQAAAHRRFALLGDAERVEPVAVGDGVRERVAVAGRVHHEVTSVAGYDGVQRALIARGESPRGALAWARGGCLRAAAPAHMCGGGWLLRAPAAACLRLFSSVYKIFYFWKREIRN
jgi:hypothetical protein